MILYLNGKFCSQSEALLSPFDRGFLYGEGLFETIRCYKGTAFLLNRHLERLFNGLEELKIKIPIKKRDFKPIIKKLLQQNQLLETDAYLRITVTRGVTGSVRDFSSEKPTVLIFARNLDSKYYDSLRKKGVVLRAVKYYRSFLPHLKHTGYLPSIYGMLNNPDVYDVVFLDDNENLLETATSNIFFIKNNQIFTPASKILKGIQREFVMEILNKQGLSVSEIDINVNQISEYESAFITNSLVELLPVKKIGNKVFNITQPLNIYGLIKKEIQKKLKNIS